MYIAAKTEDDDTVFWTGSTWSYDFGDASEYGAMGGAWEMGTLEAEYTEEPRKTWRGLTIRYIYEL